MTRDRLDSDQMMLTHEFLALMLGVRRAGVSQALLEKMGLVRTAPGSVTIMDRDGLEECANGLYGTPRPSMSAYLGPQRKVTHALLHPCCDR